MPTTVTKTIKPSGGDYTSLSAWEAGEQANLVTADEIAVAECYAMQDTTVVDVNGWTTDATRYIKIYTPTSERHNGKWDATAYRLEVNSTTRALKISEQNVRVFGLQIYNSNASGLPVYYATTVSSGEFQFAYNIVRGSAYSSNSNSFLLVPEAGSTIKIWNNIIYDAYRGIRYSYGDAGSTFIIYNNTVVDSQLMGIQITDSVGDVTLYLKNNLVQGANTNYSITSFTSLTTSNNISEDATSPDVSYRNKTVTFVDEASDDFHLASGDTEAKDNGTDLSADGQLSFSDDIDGETRS